MRDQPIQWPGFTPPRDSTSPPLHWPSFTPALTPQKTTRYSCTLSTADLTTVTASSPRRRKQPWLQKNGSTAKQPNRPSSPARQKRLSLCQSTGRAHPCRAQKKNGPLLAAAATPAEATAVAAPHKRASLSLFRLALAASAPEPHFRNCRVDVRGTASALTPHFPGSRGRDSLLVT